MPSASRIPVTVIAGAFGSGKTTLVNRILDHHHGRRVAVIENDLGEIDVDRALLAPTDEAIVEINTDCADCTVRGDLIRILRKLRRHRDRFDRVVVETSGAARLAPIAQTFFVDSEVRNDYRLDGVVTVVDATSGAHDLDKADENDEPIGFADVLVLNKIDLVDENRLVAIERRLRAINGMARMRRARRAAVSVDEVIEVGGFDLARTTERWPGFLEPERPFQWGGIFELATGAELVVGPGRHATMVVVVVPVARATDAALGAASSDAALALLGERRTLEPGLPLTVADGPNVLRLRGSRRWPVDAAPGQYAVFAEHGGNEYDVRIEVGRNRHPPSNARSWPPSRPRDTMVASVGLAIYGALDEEKLTSWIRDLLRTRGTDIIRVKGVLELATRDDRFVVDGLHGRCTGRRDRPWGSETRRSVLSVVGHNLDQSALEAELRACLA